jgi:hypothetical protein
MSDTDGLRHRAASHVSDVEEEDYLPDPMATECRWAPLITVVCGLFYLHGVALGWYMCSK